MIGHPAVGVDFRAIIIRGVYQARFQSVPVLLITKYRLTGIAPHCDVIKGIRDVKRSIAHPHRMLRQMERGSGLGAV